MMFKLYFFIRTVICLLCAWSCEHDAGVPEAVGMRSQVIDSVTAKILPSKAGGFGYDIYINGIKSIQQPYMPVVAGYLGFPDSAKAAKVATLVITKIHANKLPPTVSRKEMDSLGIF